MQVDILRGIEKRYSEISIMNFPAASLFPNCYVGVYENCWSLYFHSLGKHSGYDNIITFFFHLLLTLKLKAYNQGDVLFVVT